MAISETNIVNMALARIGAKRINNLESDTSLEAIQAREHYESSRDALLRSHWWRFARARATLSEDATVPAFGYTHQYILPTDFLRLIAMYDRDAKISTSTTFAMEGRRLLSDESTVNILYIRRVTDVSEFDPLFVKVLALQLALDLIMPLSKDKALRQLVAIELADVLAKTRQVNLQETANVGRDDLQAWNDQRGVSTLGQINNA